MDKLIFLGTGHALAYHCYSTCVALTDDTHYFMTDGGSGNGVLLQMERAGISPDQITDLFISHRHTDHLIGVIWLVRVIGHTFDRSGRTTPLTLYGEASVLDTLRTCCELLVSSSVAAHFDKEIIFLPVKDGETCTIGPWPVTFFDTGAAKTVQYGWRAQLTNGESCVFLGDEPLTDTGLRTAQSAEHIIHEAMCLSSDADKYEPQSALHQRSPPAFQRPHRRTRRSRCDCAHRIILDSKGEHHVNLIRHLANAAANSAA